MISSKQSRAECAALWDAVTHAAEGSGRIGAPRACLAHPCAAHELDVPQLYSDLAAAHRAGGQYAEAIDAWEGAIDTGYRSVPHPRAELAELLLEAGRRADADDLYARLRGECTDDVWLYNSAGISYARAGDHAEAVRWLDAGVELALATDDPEEVLDQLLHFRRASQQAMGKDSNDGLAQRAAVFQRPRGARRTITDFYGGPEPTPQPCNHCGWHTEDPSSASAGGFASDSDSVVPTRNGTSTVSRNQPCPCGSGRKYKRCHGNDRT